MLGIPHYRLFPIRCQIVVVFLRVFHMYVIMFSLILGCRGCPACAFSDVRVDHGTGDQRNSGNVAIRHEQLRELQVVPQVPVGPADAHRQHLTWCTHRQEQLHQLQQPALPPVIHGTEPGISPTSLKAASLPPRFGCCVHSKVRGR